MGDARQGAGLSGLKDRVTSVSGQVFITSETEQGTELKVNIPRIDHGQ